MRPRFVGTTIQTDGTYAESVAVSLRKVKGDRYIAVVSLNGTEIPVQPKEISFEKPTAHEPMSGTDILRRVPTEGLEVVLTFKVKTDDLVRVWMVDET